jgi:hypothetical protein
MVLVKKRVDALFFVRWNRHFETESANKIPLELVQASQAVLTDFKTSAWSSFSSWVGGVLACV